MISFRDKAQFDKDASVILLEKDAKKSSISNGALQKTIEGILKSGKFLADNGEFFPVILNGKINLLAGIGKKDEASPTALRSTVRKALLSSYLAKSQSIEIIPPRDEEAIISGIIEAISIGAYSWKKYVSKDKDKSPAEKTYVIAAKSKADYKELITISEGVNLARDLINDNADIITSDHIEKTIRSLVSGKKNIKLSVLGQKELEKNGLNLHLAVNKGSQKEPKLIIVQYNGGKGAYDALIGKGITFDTGGLNLKPTGYIETMRTDMSGAAAVIGTLKNTIALGLKKNVIFAVAVAENVIGSGAFKPGDVFRGYSGKTVEIGNTDAEGRLVLADAISYVIKNYKPAKIVDIATLTGACVVALGHDYSGLMSSDDKLADALLSSSRDTDDRIWRLPVYPELKEHIKSPIADIKNTSTLKGAAGALSAAEFLRQFTEDVPWAHLDIAGTAYCSDSGRFYFGQGATGVGVRLLTNYLQKN